MSELVKDSKRTWDRKKRDVTDATEDSKYASKQILAAW
jgi:hypothetical protein